MKVCSNCGNQLPDEAAFCTKCGQQFTQNTNTAPNTGSNPNPNPNPNPNTNPNGAPYGYAPPAGQPYAQPYVQPNYFDHTAEFDPKDISDNKVICMLLYLFSVVGVIIALLSANTSPYVAFHLRQALKFMVVEALLAVIGALLCWTILVPIAVGVCSIIIFVLKIICFFQICSGKAVEPAIIRGLDFLR